MREGQARKFVDVLNILGTARKRNDIAPGCVDAILALNGSDCAERIHNLMCHAVELALLARTAMFENIFKSPRVHERMLTKLHFNQMEAKRLCLPNDLLHRSVCGANGTCLGK